MFRLIKRTLFLFVLLLFTLFICSVSLYAQSSNTTAAKLYDSMDNVKQTNRYKAIEIGKKGLQVAEETKDTTMRGLILENISGIFLEMGKYDSARVYIQEAISWYRYCGDEMDILWCRYYLGIAFSLQGLYEEAINECKQILQSPYISEDDRLYAFVLNELGNIYYYQSLYNKATEMYIKIFPYVKHDTVQFIDYAINLGAALKAMKMYDSSIVVLQQGLEYAEKSNWKLEKAALLSSLSDNWMALGRFNDAISCIDEAIMIREESGDSLGLSNSYKTKGSILVEKGAYYLAKDYYFRSLKINESLNIPSSTAGTYYLIGECLQYTHEHEAALAYFEQGYKIAVKIGAGVKIEAALKGMALSWMALHDTKKSVDFMNRFITVHDSILSIDGGNYIHPNVSTMPKKTEKPYKRLINVLTISLLICSVILLLYRNRNLKTAIKRNADEKNI